MQTQKRPKKRSLKYCTSWELNLGPSGSESSTTTNLGTSESGTSPPSKSGCHSKKKRVGVLMAPLGVRGGGGGGAPLTSPCPPSNHIITINLTLTFAASWFGHAYHVDWAEQNPHNFIHGHFCHIVALQCGPPTLILTSSRLGSRIVLGCKVDKMGKGNEVIFRAPPYVWPVAIDPWQLSGQ